MDKWVTIVLGKAGYKLFKVKDYYVFQFRRKTETHEWVHGKNYFFPINLAKKVLKEEYLI